MADTPVVMVTGARQAGKSTLVRAVAPAAEYVTLDDPATRSAAAGDPTGFVAGLPSPAIVDEVQRVPELLLAIKAAVDSDRRPGRFILTGSADVLTLPTVTESLAGRVELRTLWPLAQAEIAGAPPAFLTHLFEGERPAPAPRGDRRSLIERLLRGGFPEVVRRASPGRRAAWLGSYVDAVIQRDLRSIADIKHLTDVPRLLAAIAGSSPGTVNLAAVSRAIAIPRTNLDRYLTMLEQVYLVRRLPAWHANVRQQQIRSARLLVTDTAVLAYLLRLSASTLASWDSPKLGPLVENFAAMELVKHASWSEEPPRLYHWRTRDGEVDLVLEDRHGRVAGVEVKASATVRADDFRHLRRLRDATGERFAQGVVLYTGERIIPFGEGLAAWPIETLWAP